MVVFTSDTGLRHLARQRVWYMDGNFSLAPKIFQQVYIIRAKLGDTAVTCAYGLLPGKSKEIYQELFQAIVDRSGQLGFTPDPTKVHLDFEQATISTTKDVFGQYVSVLGCF